MSFEEVVERKQAHVPRIAMIETEELKLILNKTKKAKQAVFDASTLVGILRNKVPFRRDLYVEAEGKIPDRQSEYVTAACDATDKLFDLIKKIELQATEKA